MYFEGTTILDLSVMSFWLPSSCFLTAEVYNFGHAAGQSHPASTAEVITASYLHITESIFQMLVFGHLHREVPNYFGSCL